MYYFINLTTLRAKLLALGTISVLCTAIVWWTLNQFVISVLTDPRVTITRETLESAIEYFPNSSALQSRLAARLIESGLGENETEDEAIVRAENLAMRAVALGRWNYENHLLLASIQERRGNILAAEAAIKMALQLAPNYVDVQWRAGNFWLRAAKLSEAQNAFQRVLAMDPGRTSLIFPLLWESTDGDAKTIAQVVHSNGAAQISGALFLLQQNRVADALELFAQSDRHLQISSSLTPEFIDGLIAAHQIAHARRIWMHLISAPQIGSENLIWNGGFEELQSERFQHFCWIFSPSKFAYFVTSTEQAKSGKHALQIRFLGVDTTRIQGNIKQLIAVTPGQKYRLECAVLAQNYPSAAPLQIVVLNRRSASAIAVSNPVKPDTAQWQRLKLEFIAPQNQTGVVIEIQRIPQFSFDEPTKGEVWFDDFTVAESK